MAQRVWRYMTFEKFLDLICTSELHLSTPDAFGDPWELVCPPVLMNERFWLDSISANALPKDVCRIEYARALASFFASSPSRKREYAISCWTASGQENAGLWDQYAGVGSQTGLAIYTSRSQLESVASDMSAVACDVDYVDGTCDASKLLNGDGLHLFRFKRREFRHENEVRIVKYINGGCNENFVRAPVALSSLIGGIRLAPRATEAFFNVIRALCEKYLPGIEPEASDIRYVLEHDQKSQNYVDAAALAQKLGSEINGYKLFANEKDANSWLDEVNAKLRPAWIGRRASDGLPQIEAVTARWAEPFPHPSGDGRCAVIAKRSLVDELEKLYSPEEMSELGWFDSSVAP